jgi:hypothetical protein
VEQLLLLALFLLVALASSLARWLKTRMADHLPAETRPPHGVIVRRPPHPPGEPATSVSTPPPVPSVRPAPPLPAETRRGAAPSRLGDRSDLRRAIVLMAVLGPCRALEREESSRAPGPVAR